MKHHLTYLLFFFCSNICAQDCTQTSTGFIPIADLGKNTFNGYTGGKYPDGENAIPAEHFKTGMKMSMRIQPLNTSGEIDTSNGSIGFLILGFSTAAMTGRYFRNLSSVMHIQENVKIIIGAQGGRDMNAMISAESDYWKNVDSILKSKQTSPEQIQVIWITTGDIESSNLGFPEQSIIQVEKYQKILQNIKKFYPNIRCVFLSDRTYSGYIGNTEGPQQLKEPTAYYTSWAVKWFIEKQIKKEKGYSYHEIPFVDWGPMLWTDGQKGNSRGYTWECDDAGKGGIHPSPKGRAKEAILLYHFFTKHPYSSNWFYEKSNK